MIRGCGWIQSWREEVQELSASWVACLFERIRQCVPDGYLGVYTAAGMIQEECALVELHMLSGLTQHVDSLQRENGQFR